jgi:hypothetical protein
MGRRRDAARFRAGFPHLIALAWLAGAFPAFAAPAPLTAEGWGDLKIGMRESEAARRFGFAIPPEDGVNSFDCREMDSPAHPGLIVMTERGRVTRISIVKAGGVKTDRGFTVGSREADIRRVYGRGLRIDPHTYEDAPAHYLTFWTVPGKRGVRYETGRDRRVTVVHAGKSITYVEGCL